MKLLSFLATMLLCVSLNAQEFSKSEVIYNKYGDGVVVNVRFDDEGKVSGRSFSLIAHNSKYDYIEDNFIVVHCEGTPQPIIDKLHEFQVFLDKFGSENGLRKDYEGYSYSIFKYPLLGTSLCYEKGDKMRYYQAPTIRKIIKAIEKYCKRNNISLNE